jgi:hypothetical protein
MEAAEKCIAMGRRKLKPSHFTAASENRHALNNPLPHPMVISLLALAGLAALAASAPGYSDHHTQTINGCI